MNQNEKTACFTGHREIRKEDFELYSKVYDTAEKLILADIFILGQEEQEDFTDWHQKLFLN